MEQSSTIQLRLLSYNNDDIDELQVTDSLIFDFL